MSDVSKTNELIAESRKFLFSDSRYGYEDTVEGDLIYRLTAALEAATRERDAAVSAIERLRKRHCKIEASAVTGDCATEECEHEEECPTEIFEVCAACWNLCEEPDPYFGERGIGMVLWPCPTIAALDGAPEPELEWEYQPGHIDHNRDGGAFVQGSTIAPSYVQQYVAEGGKAIKRKVSPWLPVEGESDEC